MSHLRFIALCIVGALCVGGLIMGFTTGMLPMLWNTVVDLWHNLLAWISQPLDWNHLLVGAGALATPIIVLFALFALTDD